MLYEVLALTKLLAMPASIEDNRSISPIPAIYIWFSLPTEGNSENGYKVMIDNNFRENMKQRDFYCGIKNNNIGFGIRVSSSSLGEEHFSANITYINNNITSESTHTFDIYVPYSGGIKSKIANEQSAYLYISNRFHPEPQFPAPPIIQEPSGDEAKLDFGCWFW